MHPDQSKPKEWNWDQRWRSGYPEWESDILAGKYARKLDDGIWQFSADVLSAEPLPLHPTSHLLVETVAQLQPRSITDVGCGTGDDLHNIGLLVPGARLYGCDVSERAIELLWERSPAVARRAVLTVLDAAWTRTGLPQAELVYIHTVLMHLFDDRYLEALRNVLRAAETHVILSENWGCHSFLADIRRLCKSGSAGSWSEPNFYYRTLEAAGAHFGVMILSRDEMLPYDRLDDYEALRRLQAKKGR